MADLSITAANMNIYDDTGYSRVQGGEAITAGQPVYKKAADGLYYKAQSDTAAKSHSEGIAITPCNTANDYFLIANLGGLDLGATLTIGETYYVSGTAGGIQPAADVGSGEYVCVLGVAITASRLDIKLHPSDTARA